MVGRRQEEYTWKHSTPPHHGIDGISTARRPRRRRLQCDAVVFEFYRKNPPFPEAEVLIDGAGGLLHLHRTVAEALDE